LRAAQCTSAYHGDTKMSNELRLRSGKASLCMLLVVTVLHGYHCMDVYMHLFYLGCLWCSAFRNKQLQLEEVQGIRACVVMMQSSIYGNTVFAYCCWSCTAAAQCCQLYCCCTLLSIVQLLHSAVSCTAVAQRSLVLLLHWTPVGCIAHGRSKWAGLTYIG